MMATNIYPSEFTKTLSSGISALVKGKQDFYILEHLVGSHYHQAGEKQEVLLDEAILGRDTDCHVRFDESFSTVSRHHASIKRDGDNWRLIQLSKTNTTFLNGKAVQDSWYLQSGDEIQLAVNGPKLIFRIPTATTEFKFTQRLNAFKEQVIRPYQTAFIVVCAIIFILIAGCAIGGVVMYQQHQNTLKLEQLNEEQHKQIEALYNQLDVTNQRLEVEASKADEATQKAIQAYKKSYAINKKNIEMEKDLGTALKMLEQMRNEQENILYEVINGVDTLAYIQNPN